MPNVYTGGTFDLLHVGHIELLRACKLIAGEGKVIVGLNESEFIEKFKGKRPIQIYSERAEMLSSCRYVDEVIPNIGGMDSKKTISQLMNYSDKRPNIIAVGSDWADKDYYAQMGFTKEWLDKYDLTLVYIDRRTGMSTSKIKENLRSDG